MRALTMFCCLVVAGLAQVPDREPRATEWGYHPADGAVVSTNPPSLCWVHEPGADSYEVQWARSADFVEPITVSGIPWSVYTHHEVFEPGRYWWRYRIRRSDGTVSPWSRARSFVVPPEAVPFPQPTIEQLRHRIPRDHPRLFVTAAQLPRLRAWANQGGKEAFQKILREAERLLNSEPTPEPTVRASASDPATRQYWWSNRVQTLRALQEAEILAFAWLMTQDPRYGEAARRFTLRLAAWDPDGPTSFQINCEAAKPMLHRLARAYDWAWDVFTEEERARIRAALLRRALDAWASGEVRYGVGHLNEPFNSHGNRTWHKLAENAIATFGETPESEQFLRYALAKFFAAYPVWSDEDGGWHEGLAYLASYMSKATWWLDVARVALDIDGFKKPFFSRIGDYPLYSAPPGSPDMGFGDLAHGQPSASWSFLYYYARQVQNPYWVWWLEAWKIPEETGEPVLDFLRSALPRVQPRAPAELPASKVFWGTGVAILNTNLLDGRRNVQVRFKSSPMGTWSHGLDPQNSFTLNAYGERLLVNCVYRDLYGSPFHRGWVWSTRAHNAVLVNGQGQKPRARDARGRIVHASLQDGFDYVAGDATEAYEGRLKRALRHVLFVKPDVVVLVDEVEASEPSTFQWMLHGMRPFQLDGARLRLSMEAERASLLVDYISPVDLSLKQWTGYDPEPDYAYLQAVNSRPIPPQWHVEASSQRALRQLCTLTVIRVSERLRADLARPTVQWKGDGFDLEVASPGGRVVFLHFRPASGEALVVVRKAEKEWRVSGS